MDSGKKRNYSLDVLKIVAVTMIIFHHYQQITEASFQNGINFCQGRFYFGYLVELFFVLSGFFMYEYVEKIENGMSFGNFYAKRFIRFFPMLFTSCVVYEILDVIYRFIYGDYFFGGKAGIVRLAAGIMGMQAGWVFDGPLVNNPLWYVSVLLLCCIFLFLIVWTAKRLNLRVMNLFIFAMLFGIGIIKYEISLPFFNSYTGRGMISFFAGVILAALIKNHDVSKQVENFCAVVFVISTALFVFSPNAPGTGTDMLVYVTIFMFCPLVVFFNSERMTRLFRNRWIGIVGQISFNAFALHMPVLILLYIGAAVFGFEISRDSILSMLVFTVACYALGTLTFFTIEKPAVKKLNSLLKKTD